MLRHLNSIRWCHGKLDIGCGGPAREMGSGDFVPWFRCGKYVYKIWFLVDFQPDLVNYSNRLL
jgi:hypothetical protein